MSLASPATTARADRLGWSLALLALAQLIFSLDITIVIVALPDVGSHLDFTPQTLQWVVDAYSVFTGGFLLLGGRAADLLGRRRVFVTALTLYAVSSLAGGLAQTAAVLVVARAVQGIGGALLLPSTLALINHLFAEGPARNRALAVWGGAGASGLTVGSLLGGVLTQGFGWPAVFFVNVPLAAAVAVAALMVIPSDTASIGGRSFDLPGALTVTGGTTALVCALVQGPQWGWSSPAAVATLAAGLLLLAAFLAIERHSADPLMPVSLLRSRGLRTGMSITFVYMGSFGSLTYFLTVLFQKVHHFSAFQAGLAFLLPSLAIAVGTQVGERLTTRFGARRPLTGGFVVGAAGCVLLATTFTADTGYLAAVPGLLITGIGQGTVWTAMWIAAASGVPAQHYGVASGMASTTLNVGNAIGLALLVALAHTAGAATGGRTAVFAIGAAALAGAIAAGVLPRSETAPATGAAEPVTTTL